MHSQTHRQTDRQCNLETELAQWADAVEINATQIYKSLSEYLVRNQARLYYTWLELCIVQGVDCVLS